MNLREFGRAGHWPTLACAFLYFDMSFMVWVLLGALANFIIPAFGLSDMERGLMVAVPILGGAVLRIVLGLMTDYFGARRTGLCALSLTLIPLALGWLWADTFGKLLLVGMLLGVAGASFAVALPLVSHWYPPRFQGLAMGIAGAGNSGTVLASFFAPLLAEALGWRNVFGLALLPCSVILLLFSLFARESPGRPPRKSVADYLDVVRQRDVWWLCLYYAVTFGGFVGLASYLSIFFRGRYGLGPIHAGTLATLCLISGSFLRPVGGHLADAFGGARLLNILYIAAGALLLDLSTSPPLVWGTILMVMVTGLLGLGNGAVFQLVPQRFPRDMGVATGVVGATGALGGFLLPTVLGGMKQITGGYSGAFLIFAAVCFASAYNVMRVSQDWEGPELADGGLAAGGAASGLAVMATSPRAN